MTTNDYPYIRMWGRNMGSFENYIDLVVDQARDDNAPANAVYKNHEGQWQTTDDITVPATRVALGLEPWPLEPLDAKRLVEQLDLGVTQRIPLTDMFGLEAIQHLPDNAGLRLIFSTGYSAELRLTVHEPEGEDPNG